MNRALTRVAELDGSGRVVGLEERPAVPKSDLALVGVHLFARTVHEAGRAVVPSRRGELEIIGRVRIDDGAKVFGSRIVGPAVVGAGTVIAGSYDVPFTSIAEGLPDRGLPHRPPRRGHPLAPAAHRLVPGDHSKVQIP